MNAADTGLTEPAAPEGEEDLRVDALALDPRSPNVLYAGTGNGVYKTTEGAKTWKLLAARPRNRASVYTGCPTRCASTIASGSPRAPSSVSTRKDTSRFSVE